MPAKKSSKWITHVKAYSKANNCSYGDAMSRAKPSYQKGGGIVKDAHDWLKKEKLISRGANYSLDHDLKGYGRHRQNFKRSGGLPKLDRFCLGVGIIFSS